jgi:hypothetical protein
MLLTEYILLNGSCGRCVSLPETTVWALLSVKRGGAAPSLLAFYMAWAQLIWCGTRGTDSSPRLVRGQSAAWVCIASLAGTWRAMTSPVAPTASYGRYCAVHVHVAVVAYRTSAGARSIRDAISASAADGGARQCTRPWHKHVHDLLGDTLGPTVLAQCAARSKIEGRTIVKRAIALKYRRHWLDKIAAKTAPPPRQHSWGTLFLYHPKNLARRSGTPVCSRVIYGTNALPAKTGGWCSPAPETQCGISTVRKCASMGPPACGSPLQPTTARARPPHGRVYRLRPRQPLARVVPAAW